MHTRRDDPDLPRARRRCARASWSHHVDAGPGRRRCPRTSCCRTWTRSPPTCASAAGAPTGPTSSTRTSGCPASRRCRPRASSACRSCRPSTRSASVKRRYQGDADTSPPERLAVERRPRRRTPTASSPRAPTRSSSSCASAPTATGSPSCPCGVDLDAVPARRAGRAPPRPAPRRGSLCVGRLVERKGVGNAISRARGAARTPSWSSPAARRATRWTTTRRRGACARSPPSHGVADRVELRGRVGARRTLPALLRSADAGRVACPGTSRSASCRWRRWRAACPSSPRAVGGHDRHRRRRRHRRPRAAARPRAPRRRRSRALLDDPARRAALRRGGRAPRAPPLRLEPRRGRRRSTSTRALAARPRRAPAPRPSGASPARRRRRRAPRRSCGDGARRAAGRGRATASAGARDLARRACSSGGRAARRRQRRQRRAGAAPDRRAGRPLRDRAPRRSARSACTATPPR